MAKQLSKRTLKLHKLEFAVFRNRPEIFETSIQTPGETPRKVLLAVSGGADSIAMLRILARLRERWGFAIEVAYVHHGESNDVAVSRYRKRAGEIVEKMARSLEAPFCVLPVEWRNAEGRSQAHHRSEEAMRDARFAALEKYAATSGCEIIALAHQYDDLFETRLIRLLRGTGPYGLIAMKPIAKTATGRILWRPLLTARRVDIEAYLADMGLKQGRNWLQDPSNSDARYLRNDIRKRLVPMLERIRAGGADSMARSLDLMADLIADSESISGASSGASFVAETENHDLDRRQLLNLTVARRRESLSKWVRIVGVRGFSQAHCDEILKRIDTPQRSLRFKVCGRVWLVDTKIRLAPLEVASQKD